MSAIYSLALGTGANRVVRGARIEHVVGDPALGPEKDRAYGLQIVRTAVRALTAEVTEPTLFDPLAAPAREPVDLAQAVGVGGD